MWRGKNRKWVYRAIDLTLLAGIPPVADHLVVSGILNPRLFFMPHPGTDIATVLRAARDNAPPLPCSFRTPAQALFLGRSNEPFVESVQIASGDWRSHAFVGECVTDLAQRQTGGLCLADDGLGTMSERLPDDSHQLALLRPDMPSPDELRPWLDRISESRWFTNFGPLCQELEGRLAASIWHPQQPVIAAVSSGTAGLELALDALDLPRDAGILLPSLTFPATATAVLRAGLTPVFCDVDAHSWALTPNLAREALDSVSGNIAGVLPVAIFGRPLDPLGWDQFTRDTGLPVVIDAAGAFGNQSVGDRTPAVFSLHATKAFAAGEGGIVASCDPEFIARIRDASNFGFRDKSDMVLRPGTNAKMSEYHAAVGLAALRRWPRSAWRRRLLSARYERALLSRLGGRVVLQQGSPRHWIRSVFNVRIPRLQVDEPLLAGLSDRGIECRRWYCPALHEHPAFSRHQRSGELPVTRELSSELLGLPFHLDLNHCDIWRVANELGELIGD